LLGGVLAASAVVATAQDYPNRPVRIVTAGAGSGTDYVARLMAAGMADRFKQSFVVENRASGLITADTVAKAAPDGYTLLSYGSTVWIAPLLQQTPYDPVRDFAPITILGGSPHVIVVHPSLPVNSVKELIALAKQKPGQLNDASLGNGTSTHLGAELFKAMTGVNIVRIPYKAGAQQMADLIAGRAQLAFVTSASATPHVKAGKLRAIGVTSAGPSRLAPDLTPVAETVPGYTAGANYVMFAPSKTPAPILRRLNQEAVAYLHMPETKEAFFKAGLEANGSTAEQLAETMKTEMTRLGKVIKDNNISGGD
jgi:tripartite-type tricarboxylate transporter receptor subunit TctC